MYVARKFNGGKRFVLVPYTYKLENYNYIFLSIADFTTTVK